MIARNTPAISAGRRADLKAILTIYGVLAFIVALGIETGAFSNLAASFAARAEICAELADEVQQAKLSKDRYLAARCPASMIVD